MHQHKAEFVWKQLALKNICKKYRCPYGHGFSGLDLSHVENQLCVDVLP